MSNKRVTPVHPIYAITATREVNKGNTYFRQLDQWRIASELFADARRFKEELLRRKKARESR